MRPNKRSKRSRLFLLLSVSLVWICALLVLAAIRSGNNSSSLEDVIRGKSDLNTFQFFDLFDLLLLGYLLVSVIFLFFSRWLNRKMMQNPERDPQYYFRCSWYQNPRSLFDLLAKRIIHSKLFWKLYDELTIVGYVGIGFVVVFLLIGVLFI